MIWRKFRFLSFALILMMVMLSIPTQSLAANTSGESRLAHIDFSESINLPSTFSPDTYSYTGTVSNSVSSLTLTPYAMDAAVIIKVNGDEVVNGTASRKVELSVGSNIITVVVQSLRDSYSSKIYVFTINREQEMNDVNLKSLIIDNAVIDQPFKADLTYYTGRVIPSQSYIVVKPTAHQDSHISVNNNSVGSSGNMLINLNNGINTISIVVTAKSGASKTYLVDINRPTASDNANLKSVTINGYNYVENNNAYIGYAPLNSSNIDIQVHAIDPYITIVLDGKIVKSGETVNLPLSSSASDLFNIETIASDGRSTNSYKLYVVRQNNNTGSTGTNNGAGNANNNNAITNLSVDASGKLVTTEGKGATAIVEKSGSIKTFNIKLSTESISKAINGNSRTKKLVIDYADMIALNDKLKVNIDSNLTSLLKSKSIPVKIIGSIGNVTVDLNKLNGWNSGGSITFGKEDFGANFGADYIPETNFVTFDHTGYANAEKNPFDIEIKVFGDADLKLANVYYYDKDKSLFSVVMSNTGEKSKIINGVKAGNYIVMSFKKSFIDINNHWSYTLLDYMSKKQVVSGYPDDTFRPDRYVTRAEFTSMLVKALKDKMSVINDTNQSFVDVGKNDWYYGVINSGWKYGLINGISKEKFSPNSNITREQMAVISVRALKQIKNIPEISNSQATAILGDYADATEISSWASVDLATAINAKIIEGMGRNTLASQSLATRAQAATVVYKVLTQIGAF